MDMPAEIFGTVTLCYSASYWSVETKPNSGQTVLDRYYDELKHAKEELSGIADVVQAEGLSASESQNTEYKTGEYRRGVSYYGGMPPDVVTTVGSYIVSFASAAAGAALLRACLTLMGKWVDGRSGRSIEVTYNGVTIKLTGTNDIEKVLAAMARLADVSSNASVECKKPNDKTANPTDRADGNRKQRGSRRSSA